VSGTFPIDPGIAGALQPRPDLVAKYPTTTTSRSSAAADALKSIQQKNVADKIAEKFPLILTSGRIVEYEGGGDESRSNPWLAELEQEAYVRSSNEALGSAAASHGEYGWMLDVGLLLELGEPRDWSAIRRRRLRTRRCGRS